MPPRTAPPPPANCASATARPVRGLLRLALAGSALAALAVWGAAAQEGGVLRGTVAAAPSDPAVLAALAGADAADAGAPDDSLPPAGAAGSNDLFDDPVEGSPQDDIFADPSPRVPGRRPSARRGAEEDQEAQAKPPVRRDLNGRDEETDEAAALKRRNRIASSPNARLVPERIEPDDEAVEDGRTLREPPVEAASRLDAPETDPYAPLGLRAGTFILRPSVETGLTASSNTTRTPEGSSGVLSETTLRLGARSDWSEHEADVEAVGTFRKSLSGDELREVEGSVDANLKLDLGQGWGGRAGLAYSVEPESPADRDGAGDAEEQPLDQSLLARAGLDRDLGLLRLGGTVSVERDWYGDADLSGGGTIDQSDRDSTLALLTLRGGYQVSPALTPFVEVEGGRRFYDESGDGDRSARRVGARAGVALDLREKWKGEIAAGWLREAFDNSGLDPIEGPSLSANLLWSPQRGTLVGFKATTSVEGTAAGDGSGSLIHDLRLDVERTLRANLSVEGAIGASLRDYAGDDGRDTTLIAELGATWWLNRSIGLSGRLRHERLDSTLPGRDYRENSLFVGTKFQY